MTFLDRDICAQRALLVKDLQLNTKDVEEMLKSVLFSLSLLLIHP